MRGKVLSRLSDTQYLIYRLSNTPYLIHYVTTHINLRNSSIYTHTTYNSTLPAPLCNWVYACINSLSRFPLCKVVSPHRNCCKCYRGNRQSFFHFALQSKLIWNDAPETKLRCGTRQIWVKATQSEHKLSKVLSTRRYPIESRKGAATRLISHMCSKPKTAISTAPLHRRGKRSEKGSWSWSWSREWSWSCSLGCRNLHLLLGSSRHSRLIYRP